MFLTWVTKACCFQSIAALDAYENSDIYQHDSVVSVEIELYQNAISALLVTLFSKSY